MRNLKYVLSILIVFISVHLVSAQETEKRNIGSFHGVRTGQAITVYLKPGNKEELKVEAKGIALSDVLTEIAGGILKIHLDEGRHRNHAVTVYVTFVHLESISASSASNVYSDGVINGKNLKVTVSSAADVEIAVKVAQLEASVSSSGDLELEGKTDRLEASVSSAGGIDAYDLQAQVVKVRASSAGGAKVQVVREIDARASSGASIRYRGNPEKSQTDSSSGGSVRKSS